ncbi:LacI family DNA-binding transcriptional regulator [Streptomyces iconiensis]|uniref:LacI family DNA-binding transcriptional regulator n=1 Tax=Streptomyces iconiensis TaxID=1384038 RepID=A0ABT7A6L6_9ACTN|nr:LacI family DNA-binding transcriptional regulator [Streptomyces iconiensis]MDJ1136985.1 LacI family DNA-binding transcriptional regulator [Streptomyces iconiensis]
MKDIAREAGVSASAVSFALNNRAGVSPGTRARIERVAERLGWRPHSAARALSGESAGVLGMVLARPAGSLGVESFFLQLMSGIQRALAPRDHALLFQMVDDLDSECELYRRWWAEGRVDGVVVVDPRTEDPRPALLASLGLPAVVVGGMETGGQAPPTGPRLSNVWADDTAAMVTIVRHLYGLGHRRVAHIGGIGGFAHTERRIEALRAEAARAELADARSVTTDYTDAQGAEAARGLLAQTTPPTALICDNEVMAVAAVSVAAERGLAVPRDISIVSWEDSVLCRTLHPQLTSLSRDTEEFGRHAAEALLAVLTGGPGRRVTVPLPRLIPRESTAPPPGG